MDEEISSNKGWKIWVGIGKEILPWMLLAISAVYGYGVRNSIQDRAIQSQMEDHVAIQEMRTQLQEVGKQEAILATKVDMILQQNSYRDERFREEQHPPK